MKKKRTPLQAAVGLIMRIILPHIFLEQLINYGLLEDFVSFSEQMLPVFHVVLFCRLYIKIPLKVLLPSTPFYTDFLFIL